MPSKAAFAAFAGASINTGLMAPYAPSALRFKNQSTDRKVTYPPLHFVPLTGSDPNVTHPSVTP